MLRAMPWASVSHQDFTEELSSTLVDEALDAGNGLSCEDESRTRTGTIGPRRTVKSLVATGASAEVTT